MYSVYHLQTVSFASFFPVWIPFIYFSCHIYLARISNTVLSKNAKIGHSCLVPDLRESAFSFIPQSMMLSVGLSYMSFIMLKYIPFIHTFLRIFIINKYLILWNALYASTKMIMWKKIKWSCLCFNFLMWCITLIDLWILNSSCIPEKTPFDHDVWSF